MANDTENKNAAPESADGCPHCGTRIIRGDSLEQISTKTTTWQKIVIVVVFVILVAIAFTFDDAKQREDWAADQKFEEPLRNIVSEYTASTDLGQMYGSPEVTFKGGTNYGEVYVEFPSGPFSQKQASDYGRLICASLARAYVAKGYMPRHLQVYVLCRLADGRRLLYGRALYNGSFDRLSWQPAAR